MGDNFTLGQECKLYFSETLITEAGPATPDWTEVTNAKDVTLNLSTGEADITTRANNGWKATAATLKEGSIEFEMLWRPSDAAFAAIQEAWAESKEIAAAALDGAIDVAGSQGLASNFTVTNFTRTEPLEEAVKVAVTLKPSSFTDWYKVGGV